MEINIQTITGYVANLVKVALRSFIGTILVSVLAGFILSGFSYYFISQFHWTYGIIAVMVTIVESIIAGLIYGGKRAVAMTILHAFASMRLGQKLVDLIFERVQEQAKIGNAGDRGNLVQSLEKLPLAQTEEYLNKAIQKLLGDLQQVGWLRRKIQTWLLGKVQVYTLARFRSEDAEHGGIDLLKVKAELDQNLDNTIVRNIRGSLNHINAFAFVSLPVLIAAQIWIVILLMKMQN